MSSRYTRAAYEELAHVVATLDVGHTRWEVALRLAAVFEDDNPRFDRARFLSACNLPGYGAFTAEPLGPPDPAGVEMPDGH